MPANKLSLQELNQLTGIKLLTSACLEIVRSQTQIPGGNCPPNCGRPRLHATFMENLNELYLSHIRFLFC